MKRITLLFGLSLLTSLLLPNEKERSGYTWSSLQAKEES